VRLLYTRDDDVDQGVSGQPSAGSLEEIREALSGNICAAYPKITKAVLTLAAKT
jgi:aerobic-type carbon monoxide dehydrogenase small subunit (CoxS/CutS family)